MLVLADAPHASRRSIAGALDILEKTVGLTTTDVARVRTRSLLRDSGIAASVVSLVFQPKQGEAVSVPLVTASHFGGMRPGSDALEMRPIHELANAIVGSDGRVLLESLQIMRAITIDPAPLLGEASDLDRKILSFTLSSISNIEFFYRTPYESLSAEEQAHLPMFRWLDWSMLVPFVQSDDSTMPTLKELHFDFNKAYCTTVSPETIRKALMRFGLWRTQRKSPKRTT